MATGLGREPTGLCCGRLPVRCAARWMAPCPETNISNCRGCSGALVACFINKHRQISSDFHQKQQVTLLLRPRELQFPSGGFLVGSKSVNKLGGFVFD